MKSIITAISVFIASAASIAQTPPMGWNSYDCYLAAVNESADQITSDNVITQGTYEGPLQDLIF
jgi:hypothetical protein